MREIKFRAWDKRYKKMHNAICSIDFIECELVVVDRFANDRYLLGFDDVELMQFTGLKDKNGVEIYEGDIVENASKDLKFQIVYEAPSFNRKWIDDISKRYREHLTEPLAWNTYIICEVIGNIYEHEHLLKR